jgi:hypothetical protein
MRILHQRHGHGVGGVSRTAKNPSEAESARRSPTTCVGCRRSSSPTDCGQIINPDGLRNQIDGNVLQTVSRTLKEELKFDRSHVTSLDWESYPILRFPEMPEIAVELIDQPNAPPWGAGEPSAAVIRRRSPTRCSMPPACGCARCRSRQGEGGDQRGLAHVGAKWIPVRR